MTSKNGTTFTEEISIPIFQMQCGAKDSTYFLVLNIFQNLSLSDKLFIHGKNYWLKNQYMVNILVKI
ncbi:hypothetical protein [Clostridium saccharobutylicum]|uniref:hypothetical protein n=1 Tax=Clostridium saccharobutylicum TaxID=169679 RepID=UPI0009848913|nr:hypothetical protein [Clostridium saccharobutylicum]NSB86708.1 hypothetical protein [Clostridium saccharobutylicum]NYC30396.1 hypothetical protein [Clostridium saccharobutylicum]